MHERAAARPGQPRRVRELLERGPVPGRGAGRPGRQLAVPLRPAALAARPGSPCSSRPPTPGRTSSRRRACAPGCGSVSAGSRRVRPVRGEPPLLPGPAPVCEDEDPLAVLDRGATPAAGRAAPAQRDDLPLEPSRLRRRRRPPHLRVENRVLPAGPTVADMHGQRGVLLRPHPGPGRRAAASLDPDDLRDRGREPARGRAGRPGRPALLAGAGRGARGRTGAAPPAAAGPGGAAPLGCRSWFRRPPAGHHRAALPHRPERRRLADRHHPGHQRADRGGPRGGAAPDDPALYRAHARQRAGAHLARSEVSPADPARHRVRPTAKLSLCETWDRPPACHHRQADLCVPATWNEET